jgi:multidrug transporter EmrE-like cation transporter
VRGALKLPALLLILLSVFLGAAAQVLLKVAALNIGNISYSLTGLLALITSIYIWAGLFAFTGSFLLWLKVLASVPLSYAYPMVSLGYVFVFLASWLILGETQPPLRFIGLALIISGFFFIALS